MKKFKLPYTVLTTTSEETVPILAELASVITQPLLDTPTMKIFEDAVVVQEAGTTRKSGYAARLQLYAAAVANVDVTLEPVITAVLKSVDAPLEIYTPATAGLPTKTKPVFHLKFKY